MVLYGDQVNGAAELGYQVGDTGAEKTEEDLVEDSNQLHETLLERLRVLVMFLEKLWSAARTTFNIFLSVASNVYWFSRIDLWVGATFFMILVLPIVSEKLQMEHQQQLQQQQILPEPIPEPIWRETRSSTVIPWNELDSCCDVWAALMGEAWKSSVLNKVLNINSGTLLIQALWREFPNIVAETQLGIVLSKMF